MSNESEMEAPVTRRQMHEALEIWAGALRAEMKEGFARVAEGFAHVERRFAQQSEELARHVRAIMEELRGQVRVVDDQYKDLPARVTRLEAKVFAPKRRRR